MVIEHGTVSCFGKLVARNITVAYKGAFHLGETTFTQDLAPGTSFQFFNRKGNISLCILSLVENGTVNIFGSLAIYSNFIAVSTLSKINVMGGNLAERLGGGEMGYGCISLFNSAK